MISRIRVLICIWATSAGTIAVQNSAFGALDLTSVGYTQNFDFLSSSTSPVTWVDDKASQDTMGSRGWYWRGGSSTYSVNDGSDFSGGLYSYGSGSASDRAMGSISSLSNPATLWALVIHNALGTEITQLNIMFTVEKWREANAATDGITFSYKTSAANNFDFGEAEILPSGWTAVSSLNYTTTDVSGVVGSLDGNAPANRTTLSQTISLSVLVGQYVALRWYDTRVGGDHGMAIDDLTVASVPEPGAILLGGAVFVFGLTAVAVRRMCAVR